MTRALTWRTSGLPFLSVQGEFTDKVVNAIKRVTGLDTEKSTAGGTSDARFIVPTGVETIEIGPVNAMIHKINERIAIADLDPITEIYVQIMRNVLLDNTD